MEKYGIDISEFQDGLNLANAKSQGMTFVILRAGYGNVISQKDKAFDKHIKSAISQGLEIGAYWFSYAISEDDARKEADVCAAVLAPYKDKISLPVFFDWEYDSENYAKRHGVTPSKAFVTAITIAFMDRIKSHGYVPGYYTNYDYMNKYYDYEKVKSYNLWLAHYGQSAPAYACAVQQISATGKISGFSGNVDLDKMDVQEQKTYTEKEITWKEIFDPIAKDRGVTVDALAKLNGVEKAKTALKIKLPMKSVDEIAHEIIRGEGGWGNFPFRSIRLRKAGYDPGAVQDRVDQLMGAK